MKMEQTECSETLAYKIQMPGNYPEESIQHSEHGESLKSGIGICSSSAQFYVFAKHVHEFMLNLCTADPK
jgi:hypothetical protein